MQEEYSKCNVLLLLLNKSSNSNWILPVKFFEYLAADRMILGLGERKSDLGDLMNPKDVGEIFSYNELDGIRAFIQDIFENNRRPAPEDSQALLKRFSHETLVERIEDLISKNG